MAKARRVFGDLTNAADDALTFRSSLKDKASDASNSEACSSPVYTTDFNVLEDTPYQPKSDKRGFDAEPAECPGFDTPQKVPPLQAQKVSQQDLNLVFRDGASDRGQHAESGKGPHDEGLPESVAHCAADLRTLWELSVRTGGQRIMCMLQKFGNMGPQQGNLLRAAFFCPPPGAPPPPYKDAWPQRKRTTAAPDAHVSAPVHAPDGEPSSEVAVGSTMPMPQDSLPTVGRALANRKLLLDDIEYRADGALADLVHELLRSCHVQSERHIPDAAAILKNFPAEEREKALMWLFQVCASVNFQDSVLYLAVLLLDRFCATSSEPVPLDRLQLVMVAILSISLKMNGAVDDNSKPPRLQDLLVHLSQKNFPIQEIFSAEHEVLRCLGFSVSMPTAADLLDAFLVPHGLSQTPVRCIAQFLLQLSLLDAPLHYRYSRAVLAAGAVYVALWCTQSGPERVSALLEDVSHCFNNDE